MYQIDESLKENMPKKYSGSELTDELSYSNELLNMLEKEPKVSSITGIKERMNLLEETIEDDLEQIKSTVDNDANIDHKTADTSFFRYKTHIAIDDNRLITAAVVTTGE